MRPSRIRLAVSGEVAEQRLSFVVCQTSGVPGLTSLVDRTTRAYWRLTGRRVDPLGDQAWLNAPTHRQSAVGDSWLEDAAKHVGGTIRRNEAHAGLLPQLSALDGPYFDSSRVHPEIRDFYEHTSDWRMDVWAEWNPLLRPGGELIARYFGRRVQQLTIPTHPLEVAQGMDSEIHTIIGNDGKQHGAAWIRTLRSTGAYVYSGYYQTTTLPGTTQPSVHVSFPLESGNVQVLLTPRALSDGSLQLNSPAGAFGADGAYVLVADRDRTHAARIPLHETFHLYLDKEGVLRTDHVLRLRHTVAIQLHYKLEPRR